MNVSPLLPLLLASAYTVEVPDPLAAAPPTVTLPVSVFPAPSRRRWNGDTEAPGTFEARVERRRKANKAARKARRRNR